MIPDYREVNSILKKKIFDMLNIVFTFIYAILFIILMIFYANRNPPYFPILFYFSNIIIIIISIIFFGIMTCEIIDVNVKFVKISYYSKLIMRFYIIKNILLLCISINSLIYKFPIDRRMFPYMWVIFFIISESILTAILLYFHMKMVSITTEYCDEKFCNCVEV